MIAMKQPYRFYLVLMLVLLLCPALKTSAINSPYAAVEVIGAQGKILNSGAILKIAGQAGLPASAVYQWKNHLVLYGLLKHVALLQHELVAAYPSCSVKTYQDPFYVFDRRQRCGGKGMVSQWDNILLTANLVNDPKMQQEYLHYHATQFEQWPQVSNGFCNADFQQLLVFKSGRQLMLIISIPHGASLDKLNPKTSENNPRVDDWNKLMSKYQEGIPGTKPGEVWVFLKGVNKSVKRGSQKVYK